MKDFPNRSVILENGLKIRFQKRGNSDTQNVIRDGAWIGTVHAWGLYHWTAYDHAMRTIGSFTTRRAATGAVVQVSEKYRT